MVPAANVVPRRRDACDRRIAIAVWTIAGLSAVVLSGGSALGFRLNTTRSAPEGLWRTVAMAPIARIRRGTIVSVCPPDTPVVRRMLALHALERGNCPAGTVPFLKPVAAVSGDRVTVRRGVPVAVNGRAMRNTVARRRMPTWPAGTYRVAPGTIWLLSSFDPGSFDSRYFGPVEIGAVRAQVIPVLVDGDPGSMIRGAILSATGQG